MDNPYQSPGDELFNSAEALLPGAVAGKAKQIRVIAVLMIIHGVAMLAAGVGVAVMMVWVANDQKFQEQFTKSQEQNPNLPADFGEKALTWMKVGYVAYGSVLGVVGVFNVVSGWLNYNYRARIAGILAMVGNLASIVTCWCFPTSLLLLVYGLIIYLSADAERAFAKSAPTL